MKLAALAAAALLIGAPAMAGGWSPSQGANQHPLWSEYKEDSQAEKDAFALTRCLWFNDKEIGFLRRALFRFGSTISGRHVHSLFQIVSLLR